MVSNIKTGSTHKENSMLKHVKRIDRTRLLLWKQPDVEFPKDRDVKRGVESTLRSQGLAAGAFGGGAAGANLCGLRLRLGPRPAPRPLTLPFPLPLPLPLDEGPRSANNLSACSPSVSFGPTLSLLK